MRTRLSFWSLVGVVLVLGFLFFRIMQPFLAPLFFGAVFAFLAFPLYEKAVDRIGGRRRVAAGLTLTGVIGCLAPVCVAIFFIGQELMTLGDQFVDVPLTENETSQRVMGVIHEFFPNADWESVQQSVGRGLATTSEEIFTRTQSFLANIVSLAVGLGVMSLAIYYFLIDGKALVAALHRISPLNEGEEATLVATFGKVCRGVVLGMLLCAVAQAALTGIGLWIVGVDSLWVLTGLTLLFSMVPLVGAAGIYGPVALWLMWQSEIGAGLFLGAYGTFVVSTSDNLIRAHVLNDSAGMHPLLALVSALGGLTLFGLWGLFLGPIVAALFYTMVKVLHDRCEQADDRVANERLRELGDCHSESKQLTSTLQPTHDSALSSRTPKATANL